MALFIAKAGYYNGNIDEIMNSRVDYIINTFHYELFTKEYDTTLTELNKKDIK